MSDSDGKMVQLTASDGFKLDAFEVAASGERRGGIVILQEIFGVTDQLKGVARSYAKHGYDTIVPALFDRKGPQTVIPFSEPDRGRETMNSLDKGLTLLDIAAAVAHLNRGKGVSLIGFCWGGGVAVRCGSEPSLRGAVAFYGTALAANLAKTPTCPMLFHFGDTDPNSPPDVIEMVKTKLPSAETHIYRAPHGFANEARPAVYVKEAAETAHQRTLVFLNKLHPK